MQRTLREPSRSPPERKSGAYLARCRRKSIGQVLCKNDKGCSTLSGSALSTRTIANARQSQSLRAVIDYG